MHAYILISLLPLINMGVNAATIQNARAVGPHSVGHARPHHHKVSRQVHNADFSSSTTQTNPPAAAAEPAPAPATTAAKAKGLRALTAGDSPSVDDAIDTVSDVDSPLPLKRQVNVPDVIQIDVNGNIIKVPGSILGITQSVPVPRRSDEELMPSLHRRVGVDGKPTTATRDILARGFGLHKFAQDNVVQRRADGALATGTGQGSIKVSQRADEADELENTVAAVEGADVADAEDDLEDASGEDLATRGTTGTGIVEITTPTNLPRHVTVNSPVKLSRDVTANAPVSAATKQLLGNKRHLTVNTPVKLTRDMTVNSPISAPVKQLLAIKRNDPVSVNSPVSAAGKPVLSAPHRRLTLNTPVAVPRDESAVASLVSTANIPLENRDLSVASLVSDPGAEMWKERDVMDDLTEDLPVDPNTALPI